MPDDYSKLSAAENELATEAATGRPVNPATLAAGLKSMQERIALLDGQREKIAARLEQLTPKTVHRAPRLSEIEHRQSLIKLIAGIDADLSTARTRLADYQSQLRQLN